MASATGMMGRASNVKAGNIEQNLCTSSGSSHSINMYPPQSPTRMTNDWILKLAGAFHGPKVYAHRLVQISFLRLCPSTSTHPKVGHRPQLCHPERTPDFLHAAPTNGHVCGFLRGKPHEV